MYGYFQTCEFLKNWQDQGLSWNMSEYDITELVLPAKNIWRPEICVRNR